MEIFNNIQSARKHFRTLDGVSVGFIPTMGALHAGHLSLVRRAAAENDIVAASIFINPAQFNDANDFENYPRKFDTDISLLEAFEVDVLLTPEVEDMFPDKYNYQVSENKESKILEGLYRPRHFDGVLTVVLKLLNIVHPGRAYFGEKDWQQLKLIQGMAKALFLDTEIIACPTIREKDGLAMSSRNILLDKDELKRAAKFHQILSEKTTPEAKTTTLEKAGFKVDYIEEREGRILGAVRLGKVRLIDNEQIWENQKSNTNL